MMLKRVNDERVVLMRECCVKMFGEPCDEGAVFMLEGRMHIVNAPQTLDIQCIQQVACAMSTTTPVCSDRGQRLLSGPRG